MWGKIAAMVKRAALVWIALILLVMPVLAMDFDHSRMDGSIQRDSSINQQSSNTAFNLFEVLMEAASSSFSLYWLGEHQENGGGLTPVNRYGDLPPTAAIQDNRVQDLTPDWNTWEAINATAGTWPRPSYTPNLPQSWSPVVVDLNPSGSYDPFLIDASFEPTTLLGSVTNPRRQIINGYFPQVDVGLPGNSTSGSVAPQLRGTVKPFWQRANGLPGLSIADLAPVLNPAGFPTLPVVTQPLIFARVPAGYKPASNMNPVPTITEVRRVIYVVVGTGEVLNGQPDWAKVICINLQHRDATTGAVDRGLPNATAIDNNPPASLPPPDGTYFDPDTGNGGDVMWSFTVKARRASPMDPEIPTPVAGISFANVGDTNDSRPLLFVTTGDGQIICLNAKAADVSPVDTDGDPDIRIPSAPNPRWIWPSPTDPAANPLPTTSRPGFHYGMAPAAARVPLTGLVPGGTGTPTEFTITRALTQHNVSEWMVFVADAFGAFRAFDAPGIPVRSGNNTLLRWEPRERWHNEYIDPATNNPAPRPDPLGNSERFITPPVVYQGNTPVRGSNGTIVGPPGIADAGFDDEVLFGSEKGRIYALTAAGRLNVNGNATVDGTPDDTTPMPLRWQWPTDDTLLAPTAANPMEPRVWPRDLPDLDAADRFGAPAYAPGSVYDPELLKRTLGPPAPVSATPPTPADPQDNLDYTRYLSRGPLAMGLGSDTNPDLQNPDVDVSNDVVFAPYALRPVRPATGDTPVWRNQTRYRTPDPPANSVLYEYVGSLKPYGFIQMGRPINRLLGAKWVVDPADRTKDIDFPLDHLRIGSIKANGLPATQLPNLVAPDPEAPQANPYLNVAGLEDDTVYFAGTTFFDPTGAPGGLWRQLPMGAQVEIRYEPVQEPNDTAALGDPNGANTPDVITDLEPYPSCFRQVLKDPDDETAPNNNFDPEIVRTRASLSVDNTRLELRAFRTRRTTNTPPRFATVLDEEPAEVDPARLSTTPMTLSALTVASEEGGHRLPGMFAAGGGAGAGTLMAPSEFRGRILALSHRLGLQRVILSAQDPYLNHETGYLSQFGSSSAPAFGAFVDTDANGFPVRPAPNFGPSPLREFTYDPGEFYDPDDRTQDKDSMGTAGTNGPLTPFLDDEPRITDVGGSVAMVDGWLYVTYTNGHIRAYTAQTSNGSGIPFNPPFWTNPNPPADQNKPPTTGGTIVRAPLSIRILDAKTPGTYRDQNGAELDRSVLFDWGETVYIEVDFGDANNLVATGSFDPNQPGNEIDQAVINQPVQAFVRNTTTKRPVPGLPGVTQGIRPTIQQINGTDHVVAIVPLFVGMPASNEPLTPGTPLLWERTPAEFDGEWTYELQVSQQQIQWRWPDTPGATGARTHPWEPEAATGANRFPRTAGVAGTTPTWSWTNGLKEYAPLISYNNPIMTYYDPGGNFAGQGVVDPVTGTAVTTPIGFTNTSYYNNRNEPGRKNGDRYTQASVDGAHSGSGRPVVPTLGMANGRQILFADHGKSSPISTSLPAGYPGLAKLLLGDRSFMGTIPGQSLRLRIQPAQLTKMGVGAKMGARGDATLANLDTLGPQGSFEQNDGRAGWDDAPNQLYPSIPPSRIHAAKVGTQQDLTTGPVDIPGRTPVQNGTPAIPGIAQLEAIGISVDVPLYTPDDVYSTRYRTTRSVGNPAAPLGATPASAFSPFFPNGGGALFGFPERPYWDRAEKLARYNEFPPQPPTKPVLANGEDAPSPYLRSANDPYVPGVAVDEPNYDDRTRRMVVFFDANNNGRLDLDTNFREAYRTFGFQVMVKPDMKLDTPQQAVDLGSPWHGKKQPGMPTGASAAAEIGEWQRMEQLAAAGGASAVLANFYRQYWRPFNLLNTGNVNLAFVKPEIFYQVRNGANVSREVIGLQGEGLDPWRAFGFVLPTGATSLRDPWNIFLRTSLDDQFLPDTNADYAAGFRGVWVQKAPVGSAQPGAVVYVNPTGGGAAASFITALDRDPARYTPPFSNARDTYMAMNVPTGAALGQYSGSIRWFNDRTVAIAETPATAPGFAFGHPGGINGTADGALDRQANGEPVEAMTDPPMRLKLRVIEDMIHGRVDSAADFATQGQYDPDRRNLPAAAFDLLNPSGPRMVVAYPSNRVQGGAGTPTNLQTNLFGTQLPFFPQRGLFWYDELPLERGPWLPFGNAPTPAPAAPYGWGIFSVPQAGKVVGKPSVVTAPAPELGRVAWIERVTLAPGKEQYQIYYRPFSAAAGTPPTPLLINNLALDPNVPRSSLRMVPYTDPNSGRTDWLVFYARGGGLRKELGFTYTYGPSQNFAPENVLATSGSLSTIDDPHAVITSALLREPAPLPAPVQPAPPAPPIVEPPFAQAERAALPPSAYVVYAGANQRTGRSDVLLNRYRVLDLLTTGQRGQTDPTGRTQDNARIAFPEVTRDILRADANRTTFTAGAADLLVRSYRPVRLWLARADILDGTPGSISNPISLINDPGNPAPVTGADTAGGEIVFKLAAAPRNLQAAFPDERVILNPAAGTFRLTRDARTLTRLLWSSAGLGLAGPVYTTQSPDPILMADYTAATMRITDTNLPGTNPVIVPVLSQPNAPVYDASWYLQQLEPIKAQVGIPVRGRADRLFVFWRRTSGPTAGGPMTYYKVLRPGVEVNARTIRSFAAPSQWNVTIGGTPIQPQEVNPTTGKIYFPQSYEGQKVRVTYVLANGSVVTEEHTVAWQDESGELPVPMSQPVNEGSPDAFPTYEVVKMTDSGDGVTNPAQFQDSNHMERVWMFWGSSRGAGGDLFWASLAPRLGLEANINGSLTVRATTAVARPGISARQAQQMAVQAAAYERRHPFTVPPFTLRGPLPAPLPRRAPVQPARRR